MDSVWSPPFGSGNLVNAYFLVENVLIFHRAGVLETTAGPMGQTPFSANRNVTQLCGALAVAAVRGHKSEAVAFRNRLSGPQDGMAAGG